MTKEMKLTNTGAGAVQIGNAQRDVTILQQTTKNRGLICLQLPRAAPPRQRLKQVMPRRCHGQLDHILQSGDVSDKDLLRTCEGRFLRCKDGRLVRRRMAAINVAGALVMGFSVFFVLFFAYALITSNITPWDKTQCWVFLILGTICIALLIRHFFCPQQIAKRALRALEREAVVSDKTSPKRLEAKNSNRLRGN